MLLKNLGKYLDLINVYKRHFKLNSNEEDKNLGTFFDESDISEEFMPFFYCYNGNVLFEQIIFENIDQIREADNSRSILIDSILDYRILTDHLIRFYFKNMGISYINGDLTSLQFISAKIRDLELPYEIKYYLMGFFLDPIIYAKKLIKSMVNVGAQISNLYENYYKITADLACSFTESILYDIAENNKTYAIDVNMPIYCSFGILNPDTIQFWKLKNMQVLYLGTHYKTNIKKEDLFNIEHFGKILSDSNRVKILNYVLLNGPTTVSTLNRIFGYSGTTSYYHLSMMHKAGMINVSSKGKLLCYSVNSKYFDRVLTIFKKYAE